MNAARDGATATLLPNGKVLIAGGASSNGALSSTDFYDPTTNTFAGTTPSMSVAREDATAALLGNGKVLIAGGDDGSNYLSSSDIYTNPVPPKPVVGLAAISLGTVSGR
jgi:Galactose oxidase, central domain